MTSVVSSANFSPPKDPCYILTRLLVSFPASGLVAKISWNFPWLGQNCSASKT